MKNLYYLLLSIFYFTVIGQAQDNYNVIIIKLGYGSYDMSDMERVQDFLIDLYSQQQIPLASVDNFLPYWNYQIQYARKLNDSFKLSGFLGYASTGGRVHYSDYSGELKSDQTVTANFFGTGFEYYINSSEQIRYFIAAHISIIFSSLEISNLMRIYDQSSSSTNKFNSTGFGIEPSTGVEFYLMSILLRFEAGFLLNTQGTFYFKENPDIKFKLNGKEISSDWMGYRIGFSIGYVF